MHEKGKDVIIDRLRLFNKILEAIHLLNMGLTMVPIDWQKGKTRQQYIAFAITIYMRFGGGE
jgi:hypothetical protein